MDPWWLGSLAVAILLPGLRRGWMVYHRGADPEGEGTDPGCILPLSWGLAIATTWIGGTVQVVEGLCTHATFWLLRLGLWESLAMVAMVAVAMVVVFAMMILVPLALVLTIMLGQLAGVALLFLRVPALLRQLQDSDPEARIRASRRLQLVGPSAATAVPLLLRSLTAPRDSERWAAAFALATIEPDRLLPLLPWILGALRQHANRWRARQLIEHLGPLAAQALPLLVPALNDPKQRQQAAFMLRRLGNRSLPALPHVLETLDHGSPLQRQVMAEVLERLGPLAKPAVPALRHALEDVDPKVRLRAAGALEKVGPEATEAVPTLVGSLWDSQESVRQAAANALVAIGETAVPDLLVALLDAEEPFVRRRAAQTLGRMGPKAQAAVAGLEAATTDPDFGVARTARRALGRIHLQHLEKNPADRPPGNSTRDPCV